MFSRRDGIILPVVLLVIVIALTSFLFSAALISLGSRSSAAQERSSTQALLAADSGLKTLPAISRSVDFNASAYSSFDEPFVAWINQNFGSLDLGGGVTAQILALDELEGVNGIPLQVVVQSTGTVGNSQRVIVQSIEVVAGPPLDIAVNVPGALTSVGTIKSNSNSNIIDGRQDTVEEWTFSPVALCTAEAGEYVYTADFTVYRVEEQPDCTQASQMVDVTRISGPGVATALLGTTEVQHRPFAVRSYDSDTNTMDVTAASGYLFGKGSPIVVSDGFNDYSGTVSSVDGTTLTINWSTTTGAPNSLTGLPEGAVLRKHVPSGVTEGECNVRLSAFPEGCLEGQPLDSLFESTFGISPAELKSFLSASSILQGSPVRPDGQPLSGITWLENPDNNVRDQVGSGILIIENDPDQTIRLNVSNDFTGLIYVIGNADLAGNADYQGAIIVDGEATITTDVQGTMSLFHDPLALARALKDIEVPNPNAGRLGGPVVNSWRIR